MPGPLRSVWTTPRQSEAGRVPTAAFLPTCQKSGTATPTATRASNALFHDVAQQIRCQIRTCFGDGLKNILVIRYYL